LLAAKPQQATMHLPEACEKIHNLIAAPR
jgi:hypothetical protein